MLMARRCTWLLATGAETESDFSVSADDTQTESR